VSAALKDCPCCAEKVRAYESGVECPTCGVVMHRPGKDIEGAISAWNRRSVSATRQNRQLARLLDYCQCALVAAAADVQNRDLAIRCRQLADECGQAIPTAEELIQPTDLTAK
jgi:hypothetical protein